MRLILSFFALLPIGWGHAQKATTVSTSPVNKEENTLLWEISGNGLSKPSWFLGTMHVLCPEDAFLSASVKRILENINAIYLEVDMDNMAQMMGALKAMNMLNDTTLQDLMTTEEIDKLKKFFDGKFSLPFTMVQRMKPLFLSGLMAEQMLPCKSGSGTESLLLKEADERNLAIEGLETALYQAGLFDSIPYKQQAESLLKAINGADKDDETIAKMLEAYRAQDLEKLEQLTVSEEGGMEGYLDLLLYNRNHNWVEKFGSITSQGSYLFAVGAGHLPGEKGVLNLLRQKGYTVKPVANEIPKPDKEI
jgi:uncharacterized protein YbaP (TraB family)